jgi:hypothetical protein
VEHAHQILDWQENLTSDEVPPRWMWHLDHELDIWFTRIKRDREERYGGGGSAHVENTPMTENDDPLVARIRAMRR